MHIQYQRNAKESQEIKHSVITNIFLLPLSNDLFWLTWGGRGIFDKYAKERVIAFV